MKHLLVLRHAKSSWKDSTLADHDRPLNKRGKKDAPRIGELIAAEGLVPDAIFCSTAKRARSTAEKVAAACGFTGRVELTGEFYHASPRAYLDVLRELDDHNNRVLIVGHNPGLQELVERLTGGRHEFPTAALAHIQLPIDRWRELDDSVAGKLAAFWKAKELGSD